MKDTHKLTEGAILLAAFAVMLLLTIYVPMLGIILNFFLPVPFMLFAAKNDLKMIAVFVTASLIISFIAGTFMGLAFTLAEGITGAVMGYLLQKDRSRTAVLISGSLAFLLNIVVLYVVSIVFFHFNSIDEMLKVLRDSIHMSADLLKNFNQQGNNQKALQQMEKSLATIKILVPGIFVMTSFISVFVIQLLSVPVLKRFGIKIENWKPFREMSLPKSIIWYFMGIILAAMIFPPASGTYWDTVVMNLSYILQMFMVFQGLTFIFYFFHQIGTSKAIPVVVSILAFSRPNFLYIVMILGIIDLGFGLRGRLRKKE